MKAPFKENELVYSTFYPGQEKLLRKVAKVLKSDLFLSGWGVEVDEGFNETGSTDYRSFIHGIVDSAWFTKYRKK